MEKARFGKQRLEESGRGGSRRVGGERDRERERVNRIGAVHSRAEDLIEFIATLFWMSFSFRM